jgi:hypothetical protein
MTDYVICGKCGGRVYLDADHADVMVDIQRMNDRNGREDFALCIDCTIELVDEWNSPV